MGKRTLLALVTLAAMAPLGANAAPDCRCRANGGFFELGDVVCLKTPAGARLAQCAMALNNTTWNVLEESCPTTLMTPLPAAPAELAALLAEEPRRAR